MLFVRILICCLLALSLPLQAQARAGFFTCAGEAPRQQGASQSACAEHHQTASKKTALHAAHCVACVAVAITSTPLSLSVSAAAPIPGAEPEPLAAGIVPATPQPPPKPFLA